MHCVNFLALISLLVAGSFQSGCTELTTATNTELRMCLVFIRLADCLTLKRYCRLYFIPMSICDNVFVVISYCCWMGSGWWFLSVFRECCHSDDPVASRRH